VIGVVDHYFSTCPLIFGTDSCSGRFIVSGSGTSNSYPTSASSAYVCEMCDGWRSKAAASNSDLSSGIQDGL
jgi:hypothetical protein